MGNPICYKSIAKTATDAEIIRKDCLAKAYRIIYNYLEENPDKAQELNLCLPNPKYVSTQSLSEILPRIYKGLYSSTDFWVIGFLKIFNPDFLFASMQTIDCPDIIARLEAIRDF